MKETQGEMRRRAGNLTGEEEEEEKVGRERAGTEGWGCRMCERRERDKLPPAESPARRSWGRGVLVGLTGWCEQSGETERGGG